MSAPKLQTTPSYTSNRGAPPISRQASAMSTPISRQTTADRDPLNGHVGHLTEPQQRALSDFKRTIAEQRLYVPASESTGEKSSHDDATLLRFLRARKFNIPGALAQFKDTEQWRQTNQIDSLYEHFDVTSYEEARKVYPQWTGRRDKRGIPIYVYVISQLDNKNMAAYNKGASSKWTQAKGSTPPKLLRLFALYENMLQFVLPLCTHLPDRPSPEAPISSTCNIVDISGVGLKQFWNLKSHMQDASTLATAHYPETLDRIFVIGAPSFFPTVWSWIKKWFDPVTTSKIHILGAGDARRTLANFIDPADLPKKYGGELDWDFGMTPILDPNARQAVGELEKGSHHWVEGPVIWELPPGQEPKAVAVGSVGGKDRREVVAIMHTEELQGNGVVGNGIPPNGMASSGMPPNGAPLNGAPPNGMPVNGMGGGYPPDKPGVDGVDAANGSQPALSSQFQNVKI
ncbi:MAG: hypothetical protein M1812_001558 [Candelaria pacifica]|nr:MAG: hypothetical protein M1812_001558 [Candelaria pacifica]